jgi:hypothetical protein
LARLYLKMRSPGCAIAVALRLTTATQAQTPDVPPQWTLPVAGFLNGSKAEIENSACCGPNRGAPVRMSDATVMATVPGMASRDLRIVDGKAAWEC